MANLGADLGMIANTIRDTDVKFIFKRLAKKSESETRSALEELLNLLPNMDYNTTFSEIVGHICLVFDYLFFNKCDDIRIMAVKMIKKVIEKLGKDIAGYATLIFPTLLIYMNDDSTDVVKEAKSTFDATFVTPEKKGQAIVKMQSDICEKINSFVSGLSSPFTSGRALDSTMSWGRVASATMKLGATMLKVIKMNRTLDDMLTSLDVGQWLRDQDGQFVAYCTPSMRGSAYRLIETAMKIGREIVPVETSIEYMKRENAGESQSALLELLIYLVNNGKAEKEPIRETFLHGMHLYSDPSIPHFVEFLTVIGDDEWLNKCIERVVHMENVNVAKRLFEVLTQPFENGMKPTREFLVSLFERMMADELTADFLSSSDIFEGIKGESTVHEAMLKGNEEQCMEFIDSLSPDKVQSWLETRDQVTSKLLVRVCESFGPSVIRSVWTSLDRIPVSDAGSDDFVAFLQRFIEPNEVATVVVQFPEHIPRLLREWKRDFGLLRCDALKAIAVELLEKEISLTSVIAQIFSDDEEVDDAIQAVANNAGDNKEQIDPSVFEYFEPDLRFLKRYLMSSAAASLTKDHPLVPKIIEVIPQLADKKAPIPLANALIAFVEGVGLNPLDIQIDEVKHPELFLEYWKKFGFERVDSLVFCRFLQSYLEARIPWITVFLYIKEVDWKYVPQKLWEYVGENPQLAKIAHEHQMLIALACICAANDLKLSDLPFDRLTLQAMPHLKPPAVQSDDILIQIMQMEWNNMRPKPPLFDDPDVEMTLRQTVVYLRFHLPTLLVFDPIYDLLLRGLENANRLTFFYCIRIFSMICQASKNVPVAMMMRKMVPYLVKFAPFIQAVENELVCAFRVSAFLSVEEFTSIVIDSAPLFASSVSTQLIRVLIPLFQYFNSWDLIKTNLNGALDIKNPRNWNLITNCLFEMPCQKRIEILPHFSKRVSEMLDTLKPLDREFELLVIAFPFAAQKWYGALEDEDKKKIVRKYMEKSGTVKAFKSVVKHILRMKLQGTTVKSNQQRLTIDVIFKEDVAAMPITLEMRLPEIYPLEPMSIHSDIGDTQMSSLCDSKVIAAMKGSQSVEEGVRTWHAFVIARVLDSAPCTICYSYFDSKMQIPQIHCVTCDNAFHKTCLSKWFEKCHRPTCPYCACPWHRK